MTDNHGVTRVAVLGAGTIGASWTALFAASGFDVVVYDPSAQAQAYVQDYVSTAWPTLETLDLVVAADASRITFVDTPEDAVEGAQFVQENVPERLDVKSEIFKRIEPRLAEGAIVASSASGLMVQEMQTAWNDPSHLILGHPFNPPHLIPLVELLGNEHTAPGVLERAEAFYAACGRVTIRVQREVPGHVANRLQAALWREAIHLVMEGVASVEDVDKAVWAGPGLRWAAMGPHMLFHLGAGGPGLGVFCERFAPSFHRWWEDLGRPELTPEAISALVAGVKAEENGRSFNEVVSERDKLIVAMLTATRSIRDS